MKSIKSSTSPIIHDFLGRMSRLPRSLKDCQFHYAGSGGKPFPPKGALAKVSMPRL
jgi:hypothetical protein